MGVRLNLPWGFLSVFIIPFCFFLLQPYQLGIILKFHFETSKIRNSENRKIFFLTQRSIRVKSWSTTRSLTTLKEKVFNHLVSQKKLCDPFLVHGSRGRIHFFPLTLISISIIPALNLVLPVRPFHYYLRGVHMYHISWSHPRFSGTQRQFSGTNWDLFPRDHFFSLALVCRHQSIFYLPLIQIQSKKSLISIWMRGKKSLLQIKSKISDQSNNSRKNFFLQKAPDY